MGRYGSRGGHRLAVLSSSGGMGAILADLASKNGLDLPAPSNRTAFLLRDLVPQTGSMGNPMDITTQYMNDAKAIGRYLMRFDEDDHFDILVLLLTFSPSEKTVTLANNLVGTAKNLKKPLVVCWPVGFTTHETFRLIQKAEIPLFFNVERCMSVLAHSASCATFQKAREASSI